MSQIITAKKNNKFIVTCSTWSKYSKLTLLLFKYAISPSSSAPEIKVASSKQGELKARDEMTGGMQWDNSFDFAPFLFPIHIKRQPTPLNMHFFFLSAPAL